MIKDKIFEIPHNLSFDESIIENIKINLDTSFLSHNERTYMTSVLNHEANIVKKIQTELKNMIKDKYIYLNDIPQLIFSITTLIKIHIIQNNIKNVNIANIIRYILNMFFDSKILPLNDTEINLIKTIIYSSIRLLQLNVNIAEEPIVCCSCLFPYNK